MSAQCDGARYRYRIFDEIQVESGVVYGSNVGSSGANVVLDMDVYQPSNDDVTDRPVVVVAHGGFFWLEATTAWTWFPCARIWLGWGTSRRRSVTGWAWTTCSIWKPRCKRPCCGRARRQGGGSLFRKTHAEEGNPYGIDPNRIVLGGSSAGAFIALHAAYIDDLSEVPEIIDLSQPGLGGGVEGLSGNAGYPSDVLSLINISGAMGDAGWMAPGDVPIVSTHGTDDGTVPYGTGDIAILGINVAVVDGSWPVHIRAAEVGLDHNLVTFVGAGHVPHMYDSGYYDLTRAAVMSFTSRQVCPNYPEIGDYYDVDDIPEFGCPGDFNADGQVSVADMLVLLTDFGCPQSCVSDLNGDGNVVVSDLLAFLELFGTPCG